MLDPEIRAYLAGRRAEHLAQLETFLRFPSISAQSGHHADCEACAEWVAQRLRGLGLTATVDDSPAKPVVLARSPAQPGLPTLLVYGHYDVQPPDPMDLWESPPFEPTQREGRLYARGASDDKGQVLTWIHAAEAYARVRGAFPANLVFLIEGEEEVGSPTLEPFVRDHASDLQCDAIAISDSNFYDENTPSVSYGTRGLMYAEVTVVGPARDLHSGLYGGAVGNPLDALAAMIASLHDDRGRVAIPGFYDDVKPLSSQERRAWAELGFDERRMMQDLTVAALPGEEGFTALERMWGRPTLDCNGIWGGYTGQGPKTVLPSWAKAKLSTRLVPDQDPHAVFESLQAHLRRHAPPGVRVEVQLFSADAPWIMPYDAAILEKACAALAEAFERPCRRIRGGGTIPITRMFQEHLGVDPLMMGYGLAEDRIHSPNESFRIDFYHRGILAGAALMANLAE